MPPRKNRPVLYELVSRGLRQRGWSAPQPATPPVPTTSTPADAPSTAGARSAPATPVSTPEAAPLVARQPSLRIAGGRVHFVLGWPELGVLAVLLLVIVVAAYEMGVKAGKSAEKTAPPPAPPPGAVDTETGKVERPELTPGHRPTSGGGVVTPPRAAGAEGAKTEKQAEKPPAAPPKKEEPAAASALKAGSFYVVVQHFRQRESDAAEAARAFLHANGIECVIQRGQDLMLVATEAFSAETQAKDLANRIRELGKEYRRTGGGYDFKDCGPRRF